MVNIVYIDTSVFGGYFDKEFSKDTVPFFEKIFESNIKILISDVLEFELVKAPKYVRDFFYSIPKENIMNIELTEEARILADKYILENVVGKTSRADCQHIALATIHKVDVFSKLEF